MKTRTVVLFLLLVTCAYTTMVLATTPEPQAVTCKSNFVSWMPGGDNPPGTSACETWSHSTSNPIWDWQPSQLPNGTWTYYIGDPNTTVTSSLQIGDVSQPFEVSQTSVFLVRFEKTALELKRDGVAVRFYYPGDGLWHSVWETGWGITVTGASSTVMTGGPLTNEKALTGTIATPFDLWIDLRGATALYGSMIYFQVVLGSDSSVGISSGGAWASEVQWWNALLDRPTASIYADNGYVYVGMDQGNDLRVTTMSAWLNGTSISGPFSVQIPATNGMAYTATAQNGDSYGNISPLVSSCTITPTTAHAGPGMTLLLMSKSGSDVVGSWTATGDSFVVYRSANPADLAVPGGGTIIASGGSPMRAFYDVGALLNNNTEFYRAVATVSGTPEPTPEQVQTCPPPAY